jgi:hypothetical protein
MDRAGAMRLALFSVAVASLLAPAAASATATPTEITNSLNKGVEYLKGVAPADVNKAGKEGKDARSWYEGVIGVPTWPGEGAVSTDFERAALLSYAAGIDPARVSKRQNLIAKVASYYQPESPGYYGSTFNATVFGLLVLGQVKTTGGVRRVPTVVLEQAIAAVKANQHTDGGWTWGKAAGNEAALKKASEPDMTGAAMAALCGAGVANSVNTDSNAWAVDGLKACGIDPQGSGFIGSKPKENTPIAFLISQQVSGGGFRYLTSGSTAESYASQDAVRALGSGGFTAIPPTPKSGPQWKGVTEFATGEAETTSLALIVDDGISPLKICSVTLAPKATTTSLATVLNAVVAGTTPASCVTGFLPASGEGAITQVNGYPASPEERWKLSIDGGAKETAKRNTTIHVGDTLYLKYE